MNKKPNETGTPEEAGSESPEQKPVILKTSYGRRMGDHKAQASTWLISFTDVMALMLTFFVMLFAMSNPKAEDWEDLTDAVRNQFSRFYGQALNRGVQDTINIAKVNFNQALDLNYLRALMEAQIEKEPLLNEVTLINQQKALIVSLPEYLLFEAGDVQIGEQGIRAIYALGTTLSRIKNRIEVVGHTDPRPILTAQFPSNWELSVTRAAQVATALQDVGYDKPITIRGQASGRYRDLPSTMDNQVRLNLSRRVDLIIRADDGRSTKLIDIGLP